MNNREHAIIEKKIINLDHAGTRHVMCAWDDCEKDGVELHMTRVNYGKTETPHIVKHVFCSERHKQFWINSVRNYGNLPPGFRRSFILFQAHLRKVSKRVELVLPPLRGNAGKYADTRDCVPGYSPVPGIRPNS